MKFEMDATQQGHARVAMSAFAKAALFTLVLALPDLAFAQATNTGTGFQGTDNRVTSFLTNVRSLLNIASAVVVTIAVIFAGYQIAFAHKRIADVAPILIGGFLIGAAAQIANMLIGDGDGNNNAMLLLQLPLGYA